MGITLLPAGRWYTTRAQFKRVIMDTTTVTDKDDLIDEVIASASEFIEEYTDRVFIPWTGTKEFDYQTPGKLWLGTDLISATPTITCAGGDRTIASGDYFLYPLNALDRNKPYEWIEILRTDTYFSYDDTRQSDITVAGKWGYCEITKALTTINEGAEYSSSDTTLTVTSGTLVEVGLTLLIDTEQLFVENIATNNATVIRGVNGTTAAAHANGATVSGVYPPMQIRQATNALAARAFMRGSSQWTDRALQGETSFSYYKAMPAEVKAMLNLFRREAPII